jgi:hypothetical protein
MAVKAARKALQTNTICLGTENERAEDAANTLRAFEKQLPKRIFEEVTAKNGDDAWKVDVKPKRLGGSGYSKHDAQRK